MFAPMFEDMFQPMFSDLFGLSKVCQAIRFDGADDYGQLTAPIEFIDGSELEVAFSVDSLNTARSVFGRATDSQFNSRLQVLTNGGLNIRPTSSQEPANTFVSAAGLVQEGVDYVFRMTRVGNLYEFFLDGAKIGELTSSATAGVIEAIGRSGSLLTLFRGFIYYIRINNFYYAMDAVGQAIQLPTPSGLGEELITQQVLENPAVQGSQWTYLGAGRWQYVGDGTSNVLRFIAQGVLPQQGYIEYEVESISGGLMRVANSTGLSVGDRIFNTVGAKRFYYTQLPNEIQFTRNDSGVAASCIIKNISFKPLGTSNPMTLFNTVPEQWEEISCGLRPDVTPQALQTFDGANVFTQDGQAVQVIDL